LDPDEGWDPDRPEPGVTSVGDAADSWPAEQLDDPYGDGDAWWERA
jgi:hypothetical protein